MSHDRPRTDDLTPDNATQVHFRRYWPALWKFLWRGNESYLFTGLSLRRKPPDWLVVVRADEITSLRAVVCFGSGGTITDALRNVSLAIAKQQWRVDKFAGRG